MSPDPKKKGAEKKLDIDEHMLTFEQLQDRHKTSFESSKPQTSKGLTDAEAKKRLEENGPNILSPPKKKSPIFLYLECLFNIFNALLLFCGVAQFVVYGIDPVGNGIITVYTGVILIAVAILNALIEFVQLMASEKALAGFMNMIPSKSQAVREGQLKNLPASELVLGDVVFVRMGDKLPADIYIINATDFKVDNSSLTGEAEPQDRMATNSMHSPLEATNLAFNGTLAVNGECYGVVIRCGDNTVLGQIAGLTQGEHKAPSPMTVEINNFVALIGGVAVLTAIIFFIISQVKTGKISFALNFAIGVLVGWVPQGLPATITMLLTIAAKRMAGQQVLVKDLRGVETLGAITLLATDKTGTLTMNQMTATNFWCGLKLFSAQSSSSNLPPEESPFDFEASGIQEILHISAMCSRARFDRTDVPVDQRTITGDATESGLFRFAAQKLLNIDKLNDQYPKVFEIPFNSENKWHMAIHQKAHADGPLTLFMKGAPERILRICTTILKDGKAIPMEQSHQDEFTNKYEYMAGKGHRVLAFAMLNLPGSEYPADFVFTKEPKTYPSTGLTFVGLASLEDPPKHGVREAIGHSRAAGVKIMMVTGDHPLTAEAIGRKINLMLSDTKELHAKKTGRDINTIREDEIHAIVIHGEKIDSLTDADWDNIFSKEEIIFARTSPKHKLQIVKRAQSLGHIVGVTGDGVNDSPALKKADLGIAMNLSGSDVSKEAASMILLDDNFASTVKGIKEGRLIFANLKKCIKYTVTHTMPEVIPFVLWVCVPIPIMISPLQILVVDLGFELCASLSYAWEPPESDFLMKQPPRRPVTAESIEKLRKRKAEDIEDGFSQEEGAPELTFSQKTALAFKKLGSSRYWKRKMEKPDGEIMVDGNSISWAYLEAGIIEFIGSATAFFTVLYSAKYTDGTQFQITPYDAKTMQSINTAYFASGAPNYTNINGVLMNDAFQAEALAQAQSAFYFCLMAQQCFNLFACKCKTTLPFGRYVVSNPATFISVLTGAAFAGFIVYTPGVLTIFGTSQNLSPLYWLIGIAYGAFIILYVTIRLVIIRRFFPADVNPDIAGLQMHPTRCDI
ncbi:P-type cation-transporting ATPase [Rhizoclosmatium globosum]|uniref:P-type cation-transporting ATPase n=1 Tax=Rhizoclosmatium globosum TaxID=329046 RepID=A0A1Y2CIK5_9FUNG|nr:P-type cation-transporting ATPase [Rhizoclosmatium globosum]|eukprot:ORY46883.1 P-type cation-transporting ATPase [Rhizoclosmatium globosum]